MQPEVVKLSILPSSIFISIHSVSTTTPNMADKTTKTVVVTPLSTNALPVAPPPIHDKIFIERNPIVVEKDKSTHSEHGVIHYPF